MLGLTVGLELLWAEVSRDMSTRSYAAAASEAVWLLLQADETLLLPAAAGGVGPITLDQNTGLCCPPHHTCRRARPCCCRQARGA